MLTFDQIYGRPNVRYWIHPRALRWVQRMRDFAGEPDEELTDRLVWKAVAGFRRVEIVAERYDLVHTVRRMQDVSDEKKSEMEQIPNFLFDGDDFVVRWNSLSLDNNAIAHKYAEDLFLGIEPPNLAKLQAEVAAGVEFPTWYTPLS